MSAAAAYIVCGKARTFAFLSSDKQVRTGYVGGNNATTGSEIVRHLAELHRFDQNSRSLRLGLGDRIDKHGRIRILFREEYGERGARAYNRGLGFFPSGV